MGCYSSVTVDSSDEKAIAIDWVDPPCAVPGSEAGYIEGNGFGAENVTVTVGEIPAVVLTATGHDASFVGPYGFPPGEWIKVVVENPGGRLATIDWYVCEIECDPPDCDDDNECTTDTCDPSNGTCINDPVANGTSCGIDGVCEAGACRERSWGTPVLIETDDAGGATSPMLAVDPNGNVTVVWSQSDGIRYNIWFNRYTPSGGWETAELVETDIANDAFATGVAVDPNGTVSTIWAQKHEGLHTVNYLWFNQYTPGDGWGTAVHIEEDDLATTSGSSLAVDPDGNVTVVWPVIWARRYTPDVGWGAAVRIGSRSGLTQVVADPDGNVTAVWYPGPQSSRYTPTGGWGPAVGIGGSGYNTGAPKLAVDPNGNVTVVWTMDDALDATARRNIWSNRYTPDGGWGTAQLIENNDDGDAETPEIAVDPEGNATAVWWQEDSSSPGSLTSIWSNRYTPGSGWATPELVENYNGGKAFDQSVTADQMGNAIAVWTQISGPGESIWANRYTPGVGWGTPVSVASGAGNLRVPRLGVDPSGDVTVVWLQLDGTGYDVWSNRYE